LNLRNLTESSSLGPSATPKRAIYQDEKESGECQDDSRPKGRVYASQYSRRRLSKLANTGNQQDHPIDELQQADCDPNIDLLHSASFITKKSIGEPKL
jgi:hypothetical protein